MTRDEMIKLYQEAASHTDRYVRNDRKIAFMDATRRYYDPYTVYGRQLAGLKAKAEAASKRFAEAAAGMSTAEIVSIITAARGWQE